MQEVLVIVSIRGTNGAGKSTLVRAVTARYASAQPLTAPGRRKPAGQLWLRQGPGAGLFVPGHYEIANGGVDTLPDLDTAYDLIRTYANRRKPQCDVLYEGKNMSDGPARLLALHRAGYACHAVLLQLPLALCVASVRARGHSIKERTIERLWRKSIADCETLRAAGVQVHKCFTRDEALACVVELLRLS